MTANSAIVAVFDTHDAAGRSTRWRPQHGAGVALLGAVLAAVLGCSSATPKPAETAGNAVATSPDEAGWARDRKVDVLLADCRGAVQTTDATQVPATRY